MSSSDSSCQPNVRDPIESGTSTTDVLKRAEPGRVISAFCEDVGLARRQLRVSSEEHRPTPTLVALEWESAPPLARELEEICGALAEAALELWPNWYITAEERFEQVRPADLSLTELTAELAEASILPSASWLREAWELAYQQRAPIVSRISVGEQVRQLSQALDPSRLVFALSVAMPDASPARVRGLARAAEWLAHESRAKIVLLLPRSWQGDSELDHVAYEALSLQADVAPVLELDCYGLQQSVDAPVQVVLGPIVGKPHPASVVEKLMQERLLADPEIGVLFEWNRRIEAFGDRQYTVDLVWREGRLVVELDGTEHHRHLAYLKDRDRDYRLLMSGYTTLRVCNDEVHVNVDDVMKKIKNVVQRLKASARNEGPR